MHWLIRLMVIALAISPALATELARLTRPDTNFLLGVRVAELRQSPLFAMGFNQMGGGEFDLVGLPGDQTADLVAHLEEVLIAGRVDQNGQSAEDEAVILARGDFRAFDPAGALCREGCDVESHREVGLYKSHRAMPEDESPDYMAVLGQRYLALGKRAAVTEVIDRFVWSSPAAHDDEIAQWASRIGEAHVWLIASGPFGGMAFGADGGPAAAAAEALSRVDGFGLGLEVTDELAAAFEVRAGSQEGARDVHDLLLGLVALAQISEAGDSNSETAVSVIQPLLDQLEIERTGRVVHARFTVTQAEIESALYGGQPVLADDSASQPVMISGGSRGAGAGQIRIYGLETGTHAVELKGSSPQR